MNSNETANPAATTGQTPPDLDMTATSAPSLAGSIATTSSLPVPVRTVVDPTAWAAEAKQYVVAQLRRDLDNCTDTAQRI